MLCIELNWNYRPRIRLVSDSFIIRFHDPSTAAAVNSSISSSGSGRRTTSPQWHIARLITTSTLWRHVRTTPALLIRFRRAVSSQDSDATGEPRTRPATSVSLPPHLVLLLLLLLIAKLSTSVAVVITSHIRSVKFCREAGALWVSWVSEHPKNSSWGVRQPKKIKGEHQTY